MIKGYRFCRRLSKGKNTTFAIKPSKDIYLLALIKVVNIGHWNGKKNPSIGKKKSYLQMFCHDKWNLFRQTFRQGGTMFDCFSWARKNAAREWIMGSKYFWHFTFLVQCHFKENGKMTLPRASWDNKWQTQYFIATSLRAQQFINTRAADLALQPFTLVQLRLK